jgi:Fe-S-cluster containining protein
MAGESVEVRGEVPLGQVRPDEVLPLLRKIDDVAIDRAVAHSEAGGRPITCCRGCSACCRAQPVPVTPAEAYALALLIERLPQPRQNEVRAKFADRVAKLESAGLADAYLNRTSDVTADDARQVARRYFQLGLVCPFLDEEGACGIYHERPFVCRQYLVTSPAERCSNPFDNEVAVLPVPLAAATGFQKVASQLLRREQLTVPLTLALEYVERHRAELERTFDSRELTERCVRAVVQE